MPHPVVKNRRLRFSTPVNGPVKLGYEAPAIGTTSPWARPTPLIIQGRARAVERARIAETATRIAVLLVVDLLILFLAHAVVDAARASTAFGGGLALFLLDLIPRGSFPRV